MAKSQYTDASASQVAVRAVSTARAAIGTPYVYGGDDPKQGFDCSGLCQYSYDTAGLSIPRTSEEQWNAGYPSVNIGEWAPGDLIFSQWPGDDSSPGHVVIYEADGWTIAAPHTGVTVEREPVSTFTGSHYVGSKRPSPITGSNPSGGLSPSPAQTADASGSSGSLLAVGVVPVLLIGGLAVIIVGGVLIFKSRKGAPPVEGDVA